MCIRDSFLPVRVLSRLFRRLFLEALAKAYADGELQFFSDLEPLREAAPFARYLTPLRKAEWVVYAKPPFGGPQQVIEYLGRYTHRVAISNHRLVALEDKMCIRDSTEDRPTAAGGAVGPATIGHPVEFAIGRQYDPRRG